MQRALLFLTAEYLGAVFHGKSLYDQFRIHIFFHLHHCTVDDLHAVRCGFQHPLVHHDQSFGRYMPSFRKYQFPVGSIHSGKIFRLPFQKKDIPFDHQLFYLVKAALAPVHQDQIAVNIHFRSVFVHQSLVQNRFLSDISKTFRHYIQFHAFLNQHYRLRGQFLPHQKVLCHKVHILVCERCNVHIPVGQHNLMLYVILSVLSRPQRKILIDHKD